MLTFWCSCLTIQAQTSSNSIKLLANPKGTSVTLRWAPVDPFTWQMGNKYGYVVERFELSVNGKLQEQLAKKGKMLMAQPIKPYSSEALEKLSQQEEKASVVQEALYGTSFTVISDKAAPAAILKQQKELENRFGMALYVCDLSPQVAIAAGLMWIDKSVNPGVQYIYRVSLAQQPGDAPIKPGVIVVNPAIETKLPQPIDVQAEFGDKKATLNWPIFLHRGFYTAYVIERSTDKKNFQPLSDLPYVYVDEKTNPDKAFYVDSLENNEQTYYYRLKGISPFGEYGPVSAVVEGIGQSNLAGLAVIEDVQVKANNSILVQWSFPVAFQSKIKGFYLAHSQSPQGPYTNVHPKVLPPTQASFTHLAKTNTNYYQLRVMGKDGKEAARSFEYLVQLEDTLVPAMPVGLKGMIDSLGIVHVSWKANTDSDLQGYQIFRANSADEEFVERTRHLLINPSFTDTVTLKTLTREVYYQVVAVDRNFNPSPASPFLMLKRPDIIPPVAPVLLQAGMHGHGIQLRWENSSSEDVAFHQLYRQMGKEQTLMQKWTGKQSPTSLLDTLLQVGNTYQYTLQAVDSAGHISKVSTAPIWFETGVRPPVTQIKTLVDREKKRIALEWTYETKAVEKCLIYRSKAGQPFQIYQTLAGNPQRFEDRDLTINSTYSYKIKVYFTGGVQSQLSEMVKVAY